MRSRSCAARCSADASATTAVAASGPHQSEGARPGSRENMGTSRLGGSLLWGRRMDLESFVGTFLSSAHGRSAVQALASQGIAPDKASEYLSHAAAVGHAHVDRD